MITLKIDEVAQIIDDACDKNDEIILQQQIKKITDHVETLEDSEEKVRLYYFLSNAWSGLRQINHDQNKKNIWKLEQQEVFKEIYYLRKAISQKYFNESDINLKLDIYTNLANCFNHYGRTINALKYYDKALLLDKHFFMALANRAKCFETYAGLDYDYSHQDFFLRYAYFDYTKANKSLNSLLKIDFSDKLYYASLQDNIKLSIHNIENHLTKVWINKTINLNDYKLGEDENEKDYRKWVLENKLFLNPMNDIGNYTIAVHDPLNLPNLTTTVSFPKYITYFNQIKQEYISYRHLFFEGYRETTNFFYDKDTMITDDYDYNLYNINIEKIKFSFRGFYSLFDKIANFMNDYFELSLSDREVDFRRIWYKRINKQQILNPLFQQSENLGLRGLYLISKDLFFNNQDLESKEFIDVIEPEAQEINKIRNYLEHKFIMIKMFDINQSEEINERERPFYITQNELVNKTMKIAQLSREAIMYLSFAVHIEEEKKEHEGIIPRISLSDFNKK